jgi:deoxyribodipyrimidine photolyase-related protein
MKKFIVLPNLLFEKEYFQKKYNDIDNFILFEHPVYFGLRKKKMNFNKLKLILHRASMKYFEYFLKSKKKKVKYVNYNQNLVINKTDRYIIFDPVDREVETFLKKKIKNLEILESPNFLTTTAELDNYQTKIKKVYTHSKFYKWQLDRLNIPHINKSYDMENRNKIPNNIKIPSIPKIDSDDLKYIKEASIYVNKHFKKNYGNDNLQFPVTHKTSKKWLKIFLKDKLSDYGTYQDAITTRSETTFHSLIAPMLNIGLLNPDYVLKEIIKFYNKNKKKVKINNYEAFVRQLIGWREYQRMIYLYKYDEIVKSNFFKNKNKLTKDWYEGTTGIKIVDDSIKTAFELGYLHHISRLMVMANIMNLCQLEPDEVYKWFMEFSIDSYDWVMVGNVYSMGMWADKGLTMRKPYISSSNYLLKMSDYKKDDWTYVWTCLYYNFLYQNKTYFQKSFYKNGLNYLNKQKNKNDILKVAKEYIKNKTK